MSAALGLLDKFAKVKLKVSTLLPSDDKAALDKIHVQYETAREQMDEWREFFEREIKHNPLPGFGFGREWRDGEYRSVVKLDRDTKFEDPFTFNRYFVGTSIVELKDAIETCRAKYVNVVYNYFQNKYKLTIQKNHELEKQNSVTYMDVVEDMRKSLNSLNFNAIAVDQIIQRFRDKVNRRQRLSIKGKFIEIENYMSSSKFETYNTAMTYLDDALTLFETRTAGTGQLFSDPLMMNTYINFSEDYKFETKKSFTAIRFYQNSKVIIKFKTPAFAQEFWNYIDFDTL